MSWIVGLTLLLLAWVELWLILSLGIPLFGTIVLGVATAAVGWWHARREGLDLWSELESDLANGRVPTEEGLEAMLMLAGGWALIIPGLLTDVVGAVLLVPRVRSLCVPPLRNFLRRHLIRGSGS